MITKEDEPLAHLDQYKLTHCVVYVYNKPELYPVFINHYKTCSLH